MAVRTREYLKSRFQSEDKPTEQDFADLIDSFFHKAESLSGARQDIVIVAANNKLNTAGTTLTHADLYQCGTPKLVFVEGTKLKEGTYSITDDDENEVGILTLTSGSIGTDNEVYLQTII